MRDLKPEYENIHSMLTATYTGQWPDLDGGQTGRNGRLDFEVFGHRAMICAPNLPSVLGPPLYTGQTLVPSFLLVQPLSMCQHTVYPYHDASCYRLDKDTQGEEISLAYLFRLPKERETTL